MGLLSKIGRAFVEPVPGEASYTEAPITSDEYDAETVVADEPVDVELDKVNTTTLIDDVYSQNDLGDMSCSIFKVEELISSLPKEMATKTKRQSVLAILGNFGLSATDIVSDGKTRVTVLDGVKSKIDEECQSAIAEKEARIEELKQTIEVLSGEIAHEHEKNKKSDEIVSAEMSKIVSLIDFIGGETE